MFCQFDNTYTSLECDNNLSIVFEEFLGYLLLQIGSESVQTLQRRAGVSLSLMKRICGPDLNLLKANHHDNASADRRRRYVDALLDTWRRAYATEQSVLVEGVERLPLPNSSSSSSGDDLRTVAMRTLAACIDSLRQDPHSQRSHAILFDGQRRGNRLLAMHAGRQAQELAASDVMFLSLFQRSFLGDEEKTKVETAGATPPQPSFSTHLLLLQGQVNGPHAGCIPHIVHVIRLSDDKDDDCDDVDDSVRDCGGVVLVLAIEFGSLPVASGLYDIFYALHKMRMLQLQNDVESLRPAYERLDGYVRQELDALRKAKLAGADAEAAQRRFAMRWDGLRRKYVDLFKGSSGSGSSTNGTNHNAGELVLTIESNLPPFLDALKELFRVTCDGATMMENGTQRVAEIATMAATRLRESGFDAGLERTVRPQAVAMAAYLEEFPGLVHFVHADRTTGRIIAPTVSPSLSSLVPLSKIWSMVEFSRSYLQRGHMSMMWKDRAFAYAYFLWFEDQHGNALVPKVLPNATQLSSIRPQVVPGILAGEFYQWLVDTCFPKAAGTSGKVRCFELYCVHLGLAGGSCVLEHTRRLAATIMEVEGLSGGSGLVG